MRLLLRLYPRAWLNRYEDEFLSTTEGRGLSFGDVADIVLGAIDARLNEWGGSDPGEVSLPARQGTPPARTAALLLLIAGGLLLAPPIVAHAVFPPALAGIPSLVGLVSLALSGAAAASLWCGSWRSGLLTRMGDVGLAMILVSGCVTLALVLIAVLFAFPVPAWLAVASSLSFNAGWCLMGVAETRRGRLPRLAPLAVCLAGAQGTIGPWLVLVLMVQHGGGFIAGIGWALTVNPMLAAAWILFALALWPASARIGRASPI